MSQTDSRKFVAFSYTFSDPWAGENADGSLEDAQDVTLSFRFAKPGQTQIQRMQDKAMKAPGQAARNLLLDMVHPDDKQELMDSMEKYPGVTVSLAGAILKGVGISSKLGN